MASPAGGGFSREAAAVVVVVVFCVAAVAVGYTQVAPFSVPLYAGVVLGGLLVGDPLLVPPQTKNQRLIAASQTLRHYSRHTFRVLFSVRKLGFGDPGESTWPSGQPTPSFWPPTRVSSWLSFAAAVAAGSLPTMWGVFNGVAVFVLCQQLASSHRVKERPAEAAPPIMLNPFSSLAAVLLTSRPARWVAEVSSRTVLEETTHRAGREQYRTLRTKAAELCLRFLQGKPREDARGPAAKVWRENGPGILVAAVAVGGVTGTALWLAGPALRRYAPTAASIAAHPALRYFGMPDPTHTEAVLWGAALGALAGFALFHRKLIPAALEPWRFEWAQRGVWETYWTAVKGVTVPPYYVTEVNLPQGDDNPTHTKVVFQMIAGTNFTHFEPLADGLKAAVNSDLVVVDSLPVTDEVGQPIPGSVRPDGFQVLYARQPLGQNPHLRTDLDPDTLQFAIKYAFRSAFTALRLGSPILSDFVVLSSQHSPQPLIETQWRLTQGTTYAAVASRHDDLREKLDAPWLRIGRRSIKTGENRVMPNGYVSILYGGHPQDVQFPPGREHDIRTFISSLEWEAAFRSPRQPLVGANGSTPQLVSEEVNDQHLTVSTFSPAPGLPLEAIMKERSALITAIGRRYVAIEPGGDNQPAGTFTIVSGDYDPLDQTYLFMDYAKDLLPAPIPGKEDMRFAVGVGSDGELIWVNFFAETPHILLGGASGMGKSFLTHSMLIQLAFKHTPDDLELWMAEPKNELQRYRKLAHVKRFVDWRTPGDNHYQPVAIMLGELDTEMERRYALFDTLPGRPQKIEEARRNPALSEPLPYIVCMIEECADYLSSDTKEKDEREDNARVIHDAKKLSRKARAAGIYLVFATQDPKRESIPSSIKRNCQRIGLGTKDQMGSMVIIDQPGLEEIHSPGRGLVTHGKGYRGFRGFMFRSGEGGVGSDLETIMNYMPKAPEDRNLTPGSAGVSASASRPPAGPGLWGDIQDDWGDDDDDDLRRLLGET